MSHVYFSRNYAGKKGEFTTNSPQNEKCHWKNEKCHWKIEIRLSFDLKGFNCMKTNKIIREPIKYTYPHAEWSFHSISKNYLLHYECLSAVSIDKMKSIGSNQKIRTHSLQSYSGRSLVASLFVFQDDVVIMSNRARNRHDLPIEVEVHEPIIVNYYLNGCRLK